MLFEGRDAAGKGGVIKRITQRLNPRVCRVAALPAPSERERTQWYFQRYVAHLPAGGEMVLFDRSWYNRAGVERVMGFCTDAEYEEFFQSVPEFERMLVRSGIMLIKYWFSITDDEQHLRFLMRIHDPLKQWKLSPMDLESRRRWEDYTKAKEAMLERTHIPEAPWHVVEAVDKKRARLNCIAHLLTQIPYEAVPHDDPRAAGRASTGRTTRARRCRKASMFLTCTPTGSIDRARRRRSAARGPPISPHNAVTLTKPQSFTPNLVCGFVRAAAVGHYSGGALPFCCLCATPFRKAAYFARISRPSVATFTGACFIFWVIYGLWARKLGAAFLQRARMQFWRGLCRCAFR